MRKLFVAALVCAASVTVSPTVQARSTTLPPADGAVLIPTHIGAATLIPAQYEGRAHHHHSRHRHHRHPHH